MIVILSFLFISCGGIKKISVNKISNRDGIFVYKGKPYNGVTVSFYKKDKPKEERYYRNGKLYKVLEWDKNGKLKKEKDLWAYEYGAYVKDGKNLLLAAASSRNFDKIIAKSQADANARVKLSYLFQYYSEILYDTYNKSVKNNKLSQKELEDSFKLITDNEILPSIIEKDVIVLTFVGNRHMKSYDEEYCSEVMSRLSDINASILKLDLSENFKKLLNKNSQKAHDFIKNKWYNHLIEVDKNSKVTIKEIKELMDEDGIDDYKLDLYFNGNKKKLVFKKKNIVTVLSWYSNGKKKEKLTYKNKKLSGKILRWSEKGKKILEANYTNGKFDGLVIKWLPNGNKIEELNYKNGTLNGKQTKWFSNGNKKEESVYLYGNLNDMFTLYYENGKKAIEVTYSNGKKDGFFFSYHDNGNVKEEYFIIEDKIDGDYKSYYNNKQKKIIGKYKKGKKNGLFKKYHKNGKLAKKLKYKNGNPTGYLNRWYKNRKKAETGKYINGLKSGWFKTYHENGKISEKIKYKKGLKEGKYTKWYKNGKKAEFGQFKNNLKEGIFTYISENGEKKKVVFKKGKIVNN